MDFDADRWVAIAKNAGMKYITITAKHHDGFAMFGSKVTRYNIVDATPFHRDPMKELAAATQRAGLKLCFYYSQTQDWHESDGVGNDWDFPSGPRDFQKYFDEKVIPQVRELLTNYGPIGLIWFDTPRNITREQSQRLADLVHQLQPACLVSGRVGNGLGDYDSAGDNQISMGGAKRPWETPVTLNDTWGFKKDDHNWKSPQVLIRQLATTASRGGNYLLNVGPTSSGVIPPESVERLAEVGKWMHANSDSIYATSANPYPYEVSWGVVTSKPGRLYLHVFQWPRKDLVMFGLTSSWWAGGLAFGEWSGGAIRNRTKYVGGAPLARVISKSSLRSSAMGANSCRRSLATLQGRSSGWICRRPASIFDRSRLSLIRVSRSLPDDLDGPRCTSPAPRQACLAVAQQLGEDQQGVERRAQLVGHVGQEVRLVLARLLQLAGFLLHSRGGALEIVALGFERLGLFLELAVRLLQLDLLLFEPPLRFLERPALFFQLLVGNAKLLALHLQLFGLALGLREHGLEVGSDSALERRGDADGGRETCVQQVEDAGLRRRCRKPSSITALTTPSAERGDDDQMAQACLLSERRADGQVALGDVTARAMGWPSAATWPSRFSLYGEARREPRRPPGTPEGRGAWW